VLEKKVSSNFEDNISLKFLNDHVGNLQDVAWEMAIENGREVWVVQLHVDNSETPIIMKLNYEELSLFAFKINQIFGHVKSLDIGKIV
jgi:hypothetical protein